MRAVEYYFNKESFTILSQLCVKYTLNISIFIEQFMFNLPVLLPFGAVPIHHVVAGGMKD